MAKNDVVVIIGLGEVGGPLKELVSRRHPTIGVDIQPVRPTPECAVLHICYPFGKTFVDTTVQYIRSYRPALTIINSTVAPGTTRAVHALTQTPIAYSPIRGKHSRMREDISQYVKFIGGHCVMPNIAILKQTFDSDLLDAIVASNETRMRQTEAAVA